MKKLHVDSVMKRFGERTILGGVYISCHPGEIVGLLGRNGSGKSTLLKIIFGSVPCDGTHVNVNGRVYPDRFKRSKVLSYLPQSNFLPDNLTVKQVLSLYQIPDKQEIFNKIMSSKIKTLSGGEQRYLEIMVTLTAPREYVLLDEPFNGLSPLMKEEIKERIKETSKSKGIIITDHDYNNVLDISTRKCILYQGHSYEVHTKEDLQKWGYLPTSSY